MTQAEFPIALPTPPSLAKEMTLARLRRQVYTIGIWAKKNRQSVIEDWANRSVGFLEKQMIEIASKIARLRADKAAIEAEKAALLSELTASRVTLDE